MIVIGDVHGRFDLLMELVNKLPYTNDLCFVGDVIDRGYQSKEVVDFIIKNNHKCVLGNHEEFLIEVFKDGINNPDKLTMKMWLMHGGYETLQSFSKINYLRNSHVNVDNKFTVVCDNSNNTPETKSAKKLNVDVYIEPQIEKELNILPLKDYLEFFRNLPLYIEHKHFLITHSYACAGKETDRDDILWDRNFSKNFLDGINIFGHTHHHQPTKYHNKHWCIDTGAYNTGILTAVDLKTMQFYQTRK